MVTREDTTARAARSVVVFGLNAEAQEDGARCL
jgi:hypothetical protein